MASGFPLHSLPVALTSSRRSANYKPNIWDYESLSSSTNNSMHDTYAVTVEKYKANVRQLFKEAIEPVDLLELVDIIQRLGIDYHFEKEIKGALERISTIKYYTAIKENLYATSLRFRLLRQHGFEISSDVLSGFNDERGGFRECLVQDIKGMLSLYEASYLALEGESLLDEAHDFTIRHLKNIKGNIDPIIAKQVEHALELPMHWRMRRLDAKWYINAYEKEERMNPALLELARLDFNIVQTVHRDDLMEVSSWWRDLRLQEQLPFARDRLVECFFCAQGVISHPQYRHCRRNLTKVNQLIVTIDDIYDIYGSWDELILFTDAVDRWDVSSLEQLPEYMQSCFLTLINTTNEIAHDILNEQGEDVVSYLKKAWADLCKSFLLEAKWYNNGYLPTLDEYLNNAWISVAGALMLVHFYFLLIRINRGVEPQLLTKYPDLVRWSSMILRLCNDLATSSAELERGDVPTSIQCYMHETGVSEAVARQHVRGLISELWKKMNKVGAVPSPFTQSFIDAAMNLARISVCLYQDGDGLGNPDSNTSDKIMSVLLEPIPLER